MDDRTKELRALLDEYAKLTGQNSGNVQSTYFQLNAGGWGVVVATCCCVIMLLAVFFGGLWVNGEFTRIQADVNAKAQEARDARAEHKVESDQNFRALRESQETQQAYLNVLMQNQNKESKK